MSLASRPTRQGRFAIVTDVGLGCDGRGWRQRRERYLRTAKSCGPDAPTLASSWRERFRWRRWQTSPVTGESAKQPLKPSRAGMPGDPGATVVTNARAYYHTTRGCGCNGHPAFPTPFVGRKVHAQLGRIAPRECGGVSEIRGDVIARSEATKQSTLSVARWIASLCSQ
jgi:hypothetical protein